MSECVVRMEMPKCCEDCAAEGGRMSMVIEEMMKNE